MALTRRFLSALGIDADKVDEIISAHSETVDALKKERDDYKADAAKLTDVQRQLDDLKAKGEDGYKEKYESEHKAFEKYKNDVTAKANKTAKENAVKAYFEGKNISGKNLEIAMRGCTAEIAALELEDGKIKDTATLDELVNGTYAGLVQTTHTTGTSTSNPPANGGGKSTKTMAEIMAIKDTAERQKAIAENPEVFGLDFSD